MEQAFKYRFYPTPEQENLLRRTIGCTRLIYNRALHTRTEAWTQRQEKINYLKTSKLLTQWKQEEDLQFLNDVSAVPLQQCLRHLEKAFGNFWAGRAKYPRFKRKRSGGSAEFTKSAFRWQDGELWLAKTKAPLNIIWSRDLPLGCEPSTITVRVDAAGRWYVSLLVDNLNIKPLPIGLDVGITDLITTSNGDKIPNPKHFNKYHRKLRNAQKKLSRKQKISRNREKARRKVAKIQAKIADCRNDYLHKLTTQLVRENQAIAVEDLAVQNMLKNHGSDIGVVKDVKSLRDVHCSHE